MMLRSGTAVVLDTGKYDWRIVGKSEYEQALSDGWCLDEQSASEAVEKDVPTGPATRDEMEAKAKELGLKFDGRTGDKKLSAMIDEALK